VKQFDCADVVPGCGATFRAGTTEELIAHGRLHATYAHGGTEEKMSAVDTAVGAAIRDVA
jgi:predicted small metal-binding protein